MLGYINYSVIAREMAMHTGVVFIVFANVALFSVQAVAVRLSLLLWTI